MSMFYWCDRRMIPHWTPYLYFISIIITSPLPTHQPTPKNSIAVYSLHSIYSGIAIEIAQLKNMNLYERREDNEKHNT